MDLGLEGKVAIVTGGGRGGLAAGILGRLVAEGARVASVDVDSEGNEEVVDRLDGEALAITADLSVPEAAAQAVEVTVERFGGVDVLVHAAAIYPSKPWDEYTVEEWDATLAINLRAGWLLAKAAVPSMVARGGGAIVNVGSITFLIGMANIAPYVASKAGVVGLTRALARELGPSNVRVNSVAPGAFPTGAESIHPDQEGYSRFVIEQQCLKRRGTREDLADVVAFLAGDRAGFVTGQMVAVDGGWTHW